LIDISSIASSPSAFLVGRNTESPSYEIFEI
jgi:hypothetical protein